MANCLVLFVNRLIHLCILCIERIHSILTKVDPSSFLLFLIKIVWILSALLKEETCHILIFFFSSYTVEFHQTNLNFLMTRYSALLSFTKTTYNVISHSLHHMKQLILASCLIISHCCLHHMTCAVQLMALLQILPTMLWLLDCEISIQISIRLLCLLNNINNVVSTLFKCRIWLNSQ